jgi:23S rRNA pseudouridine1911/1915/1917 synthase
LVNFLFKNNLKKKSEIKKVKSKETQEAILTYEVIDKNEFGYLLKIKPRTGRFHQIRAQLSHMGCPIIGDEKYGANTEHLPLSIGLHSWKINYEDTKSMEFICFEAPLPKNKYWNFNSIK